MASLHLSNNKKPSMFKPLLNLALLTGSAAAFAWGSVGHSAVGELAQHRLTPAAAAHVAVVLGPGHSLASIASWPDEIRLDPALRYTAKWHFVSIPGADSQYDPKQHCGPVEEPEGCIVAQLQRLSAQLRCAPTPALRREALQWTVHLLGDIHQPLHAHADAQGGNRVPVTISAKGRLCRGPCDEPAAATNLHAAWDDGLISRLAQTWGSLVRQVEGGWMQSEEARVAGLDGGTPTDWALESHALGQQVWRMTPAGAKLDEAYLDWAEPIVMRQLGLAGLRLARFLNEAYASDECPRP
jgi:hypothetical protein